MRQISAGLVRAIVTLIYCAIGLLIALPISYFFQSDIYSQMSLWEYVQGGRESIMAAASFGSFDVYRNTAIVCMLGVVLLGNGLERRLFSKSKK